MKIVLHQAQKQIVNNDKRFRTVITGRRFGKTLLSITELIGKAFFTQDGIVCYVAPTNEDIRDIIWRELKAQAEPVTIKANDVRMELEIRNRFGKSSFIKTASWESIINKGRLRGQKFHFVVMDEVSSYKNFWLGWEEVIRPTLTDYRGGVLFIGTAKGFNHFYDLYSQTGDQHESFKFTTYDNPHIDPEEIEEAKRQMTTDRFAQEYMGEFRKMEGLIYKEFIREIDVKEIEDLNYKDIIIGVDWGYREPAGALKILVSPDNEFYIVDEYYKRFQTTDKIIDDVSRFNGRKYYCDPAEPDRIEQARQAGWNTRDVNKDVAWGIDQVRELFKQRRIKINPRCKNLIAELESYRYKESRGVQQKEEPEKEDDHLVDALRYALANYQQSRPINLMGNNRPQFI